MQQRRVHLRGCNRVRELPPPATGRAPSSKFDPSAERAVGDARELSGGPSRCSAAECCDDDPTALSLNFLVIGIVGVLLVDGQATFIRYPPNRPSVGADRG
jgi:hypothetical protein